MLMSGEEFKQDVEISSQVLLHPFQVWVHKEAAARKMLCTGVFSDLSVCVMSRCLTLSLSQNVLNGPSPHWIHR